MNPNDIEAVTDAVEAVALASEKRTLQQSPFHLGRCGNCGGPSYQYPCRLCQSWGPDANSDRFVATGPIATRETFVQAIERSGPGGRNGTLTTWHARDHADHLARMQKVRQFDARYAAIVDPVLVEASTVEVPDAGTIWDVVTTQDQPITRRSRPNHLYCAWSAVTDVRRRISEDRRSTPDMSQTMTALAERWVSACHSGDQSTVMDVLVDLKDFTTKTNRILQSGNLTSAAKAFDNAIDVINTELAAAGLDDDHEEPEDVPAPTRIASSPSP